MSDATWVDAGGGYALRLDEGKLRCRNAKGKQLASVPKKIKQSEAGRELIALSTWLTRHAAECAEEIQTFLLRSLPVPRKLLVAVWEDPAWSRPLAHAVVAPLTDGVARTSEGGFLEAADDRGVGIVDLDGETQWLDADEFLLPHPILLEELDEFRALAGSLGFEQGVEQLFRATFERDPAKYEADAQSVDEFAGGKFAMVSHVVGRSRSHGFRVSGGFATMAVFEAGRHVEARYWIGADAPEGEAWTGDLVFVDEREKALRLGDVGPVAFSEGMRMASRIYAGKVVEKEDPS